MYVIGRVLTSLATLWVIVTLTFLLMHAVPGDPFISGARTPPTALANLRAYYGLDQPLITQYLRYMGRLARFDLGRSIRSETRDINEMVAGGLPVSAALGVEALALALLGGVVLGMLAVLGHDRFPDYASMGLAVGVISVPSFIVATGLIHIFAVKGGLLPVGSWGTWQHTVMPALALALGPLAFIARLLRASLLEELSQNYVSVALAKGLSRPRVVLRHVLRNAVLPVLTVLGPLGATVLTGSFVIENIFGIPGIGKLFVLSIVDRDYPLILSSTVVYSVLLIGMNLLVDLAYGLVDPRIRLTDRRGA